MLELRRADAVRLNARITLLLLVPPLMWAGNAVVGRLLAGSVAPMQLNALRWVGAALVLLPLGWQALATAERRRMIAERWPHLLALGGLGMGAYNSLQYLALQTSTPINVTLIASSTPVWMLLVGIVGYREHPRAAQWIGAGVSALGVLTVLLRGDPGQLAALRFVPGDLWMLLAALSWSVYSWRLARPPASMLGAARPDWNWAEYLLIQVLFGLLWAGGATGVEAALDPVAAAGAPWGAWHLAGFAFIAIGPSVLAYRCWGIGVASAGPATAAFFANLSPLFATLMSAALIGETPQAYHGLAFALIVAGIMISSRTTQKVPG